MFSFVSVSHLHSYEELIDFFFDVGHWIQGIVRAKHMFFLWAAPQAPDLMTIFWWKHTNVPSLCLLCMY